MIETHDSESRGNTAKNTQYLTLLKSKTMNADHPRHHGVVMQAHHAISAKGMVLSGLADKFADFGYDINLEDNLVFIPSTLQGACLLGVQPHRGNHTAPSIDNPDRDSDRQPSYHTRVAGMLNEAFDTIDELCGGDGVNIRRNTQKVLNGLSTRIISFIQNKPEMLPLTKLHSHFPSRSKRGCGGVDYVNDPRATEICPVGRDHVEKHGPHQKSEGILYVGTLPYKLRAGN